jgi:hypothetical protein
LRFFALPLALFMLVFNAASQTLTPPSGWTITSLADHLLLRPESMKSGQDLSVEVYDPESANGSLASWLKDRLLTAQVSDNVRNACVPKSTNASASCEARETGAHHYYYAFRTVDGNFRFVHILSKPTLITAAPYLLPLDQIVKSAQAGHGRSRNSGAVAKAPQTTPPRPQNIPGSQAAPTSGHVSLPLEGIYLHLEYQASVGGGIYPVYEPYILFKDGVITNDLSYYPKSNSDLDAWRKRKPREWGRWSKTGSGLSIQWDDPKRKPDVWNKWFVAQPGVRGASLMGRYQSISGGGNTAIGGDMMIAAWSNFQFSRDGGFTAGGGSGASSGGGGTGVSVSTSSKKPTQEGRYSVQDFSITFDYGGGRRETQWFYRYPKSDQGDKGDRVIGVGSKTLTIRD